MSRDVFELRVGKGGLTLHSVGRFRTHPRVRAVGRALGEQDTSAKRSAAREEQLQELLLPTGKRALTKADAIEKNKQQKSE